MNCATVLYPNKEGARFDVDYYLNTHIPMVSSLLGYSIEVRRGVSSMSGPARFLCVATIWVNSLDEFQSLMAKHGPQILGDVPNYTDIQPMLELQEVLLDGKKR